MRCIDQDDNICGWAGEGEGDGDYDDDGDGVRMRLRGQRNGK